MILEALLVAQVATSTCPPVLSRCEKALTERLAAWRQDDMECQERLRGARLIQAVLTTSTAAKARRPAPVEVSSSWTGWIVAGAFAIGALFGAWVGHL